MAEHEAFRTVRLGRVTPQAPNHRTVFCNDREANRIVHFKGNSVSTTKYNVLTFLPKGLFEQFRRVANLYFLMIAVLSSIPISPVSLATNMIPLTVVILISLIKEAFEDWTRFKKDSAINNSLVDVLQHQNWKSIAWKELQVGDIVRIMEDGLFPADIVFLASTNRDGLSYVETSNLDGETNLKIRKAVEETWDYLEPEKAGDFRGEVQCEQPNNSLYTFTGNLLLDRKNIPLDANHFLQRGCSLRNTEYIVGAVIYTGHETKIMMNDMNPPSKRSTLEKKLDKLILVLFGVLLLMCIIGALCSRIFINHKYYYFGLDENVDDNQFDPRKRFQGIILTMFSLITLFSTIIPISLYVTMEIIKFIQSSQFINKDLRMYDAETNTPALARTSNLNEELGQVEFIFTDKTGTLTRNSMEFFKCSIGGEVYGTGITEIEAVIAERTGSKLRNAQQPEVTVREKGFNFHDTRIMNGAWRNEPNPEIYKEFFRCLAICHTVLPEGDESPEKITYVSASPDEDALVTAAKVFGFFLYRRTPTMIYVRESNAESMGKTQDVAYEILNVLEFSSNRMRQSVICRYPDGRLVLYCKGADSVLFERLTEGNDDLKGMTRQHLEQFGSAGLRTLCLAYRNLSSEEYEYWNVKFIHARAMIHNRNAQMHEVAELIERDLTLIGCTAIEDRLQDGVPTCIETLSCAGIKLWMLTGDKMQAAMNVAYACNLINNGMKQFIISSETDEIRELEARADPVEIAHAIKTAVKTQLKQFLEEAQQFLTTSSGPKLALVIDGKCLKFALHPELRVQLLNLSLNCSAVICCRVSPLQKGQVTILMRKGARKITLSIGDGANDVSMIQAANVGVGVRGVEGMQAVMASDFSIAQFRYLTDLLLVHGRLSYIRISKVVTYFFYKNLVFTLTQMWFTFHSGWSGQRFFDDLYQGCYNVLFTSLPVLALGILDKDLSCSLHKKYPQLYREGQTNAHFRWRFVVMWAISGVYQSIVLFYFITGSGISPQTSSGKMLGLWDISTMSFTCVVITVNVRLLMCCNNITRWHHICVFGSILAWFIFIFVYSDVMTKYDRQENVYRVIYVLISTPYFYLTIILVPTVALIGDFLFQGTKRRFSPDDYQIIQEISRDEVDGRQQLEIGHQLTPEQLEIGHQLTPEELRSYAFGPRRAGELSSLPRDRTKHTGFAFDSPGYESFFASQVGIHAPVRAWDVAKRASIRRYKR